MYITALFYVLGVYIDTIRPARGVRVPVPQRSVPKERESISKSIFIHF
jgi:hypothetical protein